MKKLLWIMSSTAAIALSACGGSSSGGGSSSSSAVSDGYQNYSHGVLMVGAKQFTTPPDQPVASSQYTSYYNCLANFLEGHMDEPFIFSLGQVRFGTITEYCCSDSDMSVNLSSSEVIAVIRKALNLTRHGDIINEIVVPRTVFESYLDTYFTNWMKYNNSLYDDDYDIESIKNEIRNQVSGKDEYKLAELDKIIQEKLDIKYTILDDDYGPFLNAYYPDLTDRSTESRSFCDVSVDTLPLTDAGKSMLSANQAFYCTSTREALAAVTNLALWDQDDYKGTCQASVDVTQYEHLSSSQHDQFISCLDDLTVPDVNGSCSSIMCPDSLYSMLHHLKYIDFSGGSDYASSINSCCSKLSSDHQILVKAADPYVVQANVDNREFTFSLLPYTLSQFSTSRLESLVSDLSLMWPINKKCSAENRALDDCLVKNCPKDALDHLQCLHGGVKTVCEQYHDSVAQCDRQLDDLRSVRHPITPDMKQEFDGFISDMCQVRIGS